MRLRGGGTRIPSLKTFLRHVLKISSVYLNEGLSIRWLNSQSRHDGVKADLDLVQLIDRNPFKGDTLIGNALRSKILEPLVMEPARGGRLEKPVMVLIITDGMVSLVFFSMESQ